MKCIKTFTIIFLAWGFFTPLAYAAPAAIYVDASYTMNNSGGHAFGVDAFVKIQEGINAASPGGTVSIAPGTYNEQIVINGKSLALKGAGDATIVRPSGGDTLTSFYAYLDNAPQFPGMKAAGIIMVRDVGAAGVVIQDLKVDGSNVTVLPAGAERLSGIFYAESAGNIKNVTVNAIRTSGIDDRTYGLDINAINNPASIEIIGSRIINYLSNGIRAVGRNLTVDIRDNTIAGPENLPETSPRTTNGIGLVYGPGGVVRGNVIKHLHSPNNGWSSSGIIVYGDNFNPLTVEGNEVFDVDYGISVSNGANDIVIRSNYLHDNKTGVMLESRATNNMIIANTIIKNIQGFQIHGGLSSNPTGNKPPGAGNVAHENLIYENTYGVTSFDNTQEFDAANNWWGSADPDFNKIISGSVIYTPWWRTKNVISEIPVAPVTPSEPRPEIKQDKSPSPAPTPNQTSLDGSDGTGQVEKSEELPEVEELAPPGGGEAIALAEPEEPTALFDVGVSPGEQQESQKNTATVAVVVVMISVAVGATAYIFKRKKYAK